MRAVVACGVVLYKTPPEDLRRLMKSVATAAESADLEARFWAIDNSGDYDDARFAETAHPGLAAKLLPGEGNIGFGRGHNRLLEAAFSGGATHYLALNHDGFLHPDALRALLAQAARHDDFALVEARQFPNEHPKVYDAASLATPWCSGACLMIPKRLHSEIGGFDDGFFMYCEDVDLSWRARLAGAQCVMAADAYFFHDVLDRPQSDFARWHMALSMKRLISKWIADSAPTRLTAHLAELLIDAPLETLRVGSTPGQLLDDARRESVADFSNFFGFAPFRWT